jgi:crossover junction endodeoxyribonuclease RuvC
MVVWTEKVIKKMSKKRETIILGIDPGTAITGWGIIKDSEGNPEMIAYGSIETSKHKTDVERLKETARDLKEIIKEYQPDEMAIEELFFFKNLKTAIKVAQSRGVLMFVTTQQKIPVAEYTPLQVKQALTGYGRADKKQMQLMVQQILKLKDVPQPDDAADALAVAICHQQSRKIGLLAR